VTTEIKWHSNKKWETVSSLFSHAKEGDDAQDILNRYDLGGIDGFVLVIDRKNVWVAAAFEHRDREGF
jgi:hypothetical protein